MPDYTPQYFSDKWERTELKERASYQEHFIDLCHLVDHATPAELDPDGSFFTFEAGVKTAGGSQGYADVWYRDHFAIEYKGKGKYKTLDEAYQQLLRYRENLDNPPLLIVTDIENWEIHTNFTGTVKRIHRFTNRDIASSQRIQRMLRWLFDDPYQFHPNRTSEQVTADAADFFKEIASNMRDWQASPQRIAHFLTKLVFCLFAEDIGLLPAGVSGKGLFTEVIENTKTNPARFVEYAEDLFKAMAEGGSVQFRDIPWFDGRLFDDVTVEALSFEAMMALEKAAKVDWSAVEPVIFGTLFERSLDPSKRAQLGAHYTSRADIMLIVEPVLMLPLRRTWAAIQQEAAPVRVKYDEALTGSSHAAQTRLGNQLQALREQMLHELRNVTVLDPACGSGNFLYVALQQLKDLEKEVIQHPLFVGLEEAIPEVHPRQLYGIEIDPIAHDLASIVVWIGYLQWLEGNGFSHLLKKEPILEPLDNIRQMDAILAFDEDGSPVEPEWPAVDVIVSNPPFLGGNKIRQELGDRVDLLFKLYNERVPAFSDLVCYWFEKARAAIEEGTAHRAGLLATNSIRGGVNRTALDRIKQTGDIFMAWADRDWILEGAAVRVSMVGFDNGTEVTRTLDGEIVAQLNPDLTSNEDITRAVWLEENAELSFRGNQKGGAFDIDLEIAEIFLQARNYSGRPNSDVVKPWWNGIDITRRPRGMWLIDFGPSMPLEVAETYGLPLEYVRSHVKPERDNNNRKAYRERWWIHNEPRPSMREAIARLERYLVTPHVSKHRLWVWVLAGIIPDHQLIVVASDDDYIFGVLHSKLHEVWSLRMGTSLEDRPRYTPTTTFETFPFPWPPRPEPTDHPAYQAISTAARQLHEERDAWLNPPGVPESRLKKRTLTNLYNALQVWRGEAQGRVEPAAGDFAPRLDVLHRTLDEAVCDAYVWPRSILDDDEEILRRLLALNLERGEGQ